MTACMVVTSIIAYRVYTLSLPQSHVPSSRSLRSSLPGPSSKPHTMTMRKNAKAGPSRPAAGTQPPARTHTASRESPFPPPIRSLSPRRSSTPRPTGSNNQAELQSGVAAALLGGPANAGEGNDDLRETMKGVISALDRDDASSDGLQ
jgi:hypothetical protein